ncbi:heterokaryon incompatibility protein-domain-containing protein [Paraphoma chrysanthemicola]|uniref:Heterokaryon incompatibility protein-domain-containing protein n=1 Tax=Paraphoma chrysanthemicola TaxID=798071 RepID=A0A8K0VTV4_9PLEO|nr:heterokaryon incompatibility protein-domain-containing protein [Paraphoma chrysanthemicola]
MRGVNCRFPRSHVFHLAKTVSICRKLHLVVRKPTYTYQSLRAHEIRLLDLHPGHDADPIKCTVRSVALADKPPYESLSYCWGWKRDEEPLNVDNSTIYITRNLLGALQHLRRKETARTLWIDAICINQANTAERGQQVGMMRSIFQLSDRTVVWLGAAGQDSTRAVQLVRQLAKLSQTQEPGSWGPNLAISLPPLYDPAWSAFAALLKRPWWHRAWIVQEASVTRDLTLVCGDDVFLWSELELAVQYAVDLGFFVAYGGSATFQAFSLFRTRANFQEKKRPPLHDILLQHRSFLATDPRDKVFGLLSLADQDDVAALGVRPDYQQSPQNLFSDISRALLKADDLGAFKAAGIHEKWSEAILPSWVADWSVSDLAVPLNASVSVDHGDKSSYSIVPRFDASRSSISKPMFSTDQKLLRIQGILIDQVEAVGVLSRTRYLRHVSHMFELFFQCHDILEQLKNWETIACARSREPYPTGERARDAYWHTLCAGRVPSNLPSARHDSRYKYYVLLRSLRRFVRFTIRWFPRSSQDTWYNRFFYRLFQSAWRVLGLTPTKVQRIGFPPESRLPNYRRMVRTQKGYVALVPRLAKEGDWIAICQGGAMPLVVRRDGEHWVLVGESYVHGLMNGEAWDEEKCRDMWFK